MTIRASAAVAGAVCVAFVLIFGTPVKAQQKQAAPKAKWVATDLLPMTCTQAWVKSNKNYSSMLSIVVMLARVSLANRDLTFPNTQGAGMEAGKGIAEDCKADPNALLFAIVDKHVRQVVEATNTGK